MFGWLIFGVLIYLGYRWWKNTDQKKVKTKYFSKFTKKEEPYIHREMKVDRILEKITKHGIKSITPEEKRFMDNQKKILMDEFGWMSDVNEPEVLGEENVFDIHQFCKIKYIHHRLPSGEYTHIKVGGKKFIIGCDPVSTTGIINIKVSKNRPILSSTRFKLW